MRESRINLTALMVLLVLSGLFSAACNIPLGNLLSSYGCVSAQPNKEDIVGVWMPNEATVEDIRTRGRYNPTVTTKLDFRSDGSFGMQNMPDWWKNGFGESYGSFESNSGTWKLSNVSGTCWQIDLTFPNLGTGVGLLEHRFSGRPRYVIEVILGDPDSGEEMIFVRR